MAGPLPVPSPSPPTILVVDDDVHILFAVRVALESQGYRVRGAQSGPVALDEAVARPPAVVVLDLALPGMDGVEVCRRLRAWSQVPIIVLSARADEGDKVQALDAGADDYLTKPFGNQELFARIRAALRRGQARPDGSPVVRGGDVAVDLATRRVTVRGDEVHLTPTEYALLHELAANADRVLTHGHLLRAVFGPGYEDAAANLRVFVAQVRRKIEPDPARPRVLVTEPGIGYRFRPG
jgi:two-component system KDP operon response regulator KdpE